MEPVGGSYEQRIHEVMDHVRTHLDDDLSVAALARVAHFSPYHFHRIFTGVTGETVAAFTRRARLERAVDLMRGAPDRELSSIAMETGFATPSDFSRVFRATYGCAPSSWDRRSRFDGQLDLLARPERPAPSSHPTTIVDRPAVRLAYVRVRDPWQGDNLAAGYRHLIEELTDAGVDWRRQELIGSSWESGKATPLDRLVYDLGLTIDRDVTVDPDHGIGVARLPAVRAVEVHCATLPETAHAWDHLYDHWLPASRYEPADLPALKRFRVTPETIDAAAWNVDCSIALRPHR